MDASINEKWNELFGTEWSKIMAISPEMGGFMIDHKNRKVIMDDNALKLAEIDFVPDYDAMMGFLEILSGDNKKFATLAPIVFYQDEDFAAGILRWHYDFSGEQAKSVVPIVEKPQFASAVNQAKGRSLLALIEFHMSDQRDINDAQVFGCLAAINETLPAGISICANYPKCFWLFIPEYSGDSAELMESLKRVVETSGHGASLGSTGEERYVTFNAGIGMEEGAPEQRMATAEFALYEANLVGGGAILKYSVEQFEENRAEYEKMSRFLKLINENLFVYHFQPIVSAKDGEIVAYEMLMRSTPDIGMFPLEILDCAERSDRLYDIERATMKNALAIIEQHQDTFKKKKLFVNSITAHMLDDSDWNELVERYGEKMVVEFTEQTEISDDTVEGIRDRLGKSKIKIAIDDFGTGYSNTSNLIKYSPDVVKIDRSLITGIHTKPTIRKLVSGFIEFIHENGYQALAEGVETYEELKTMIQLGSDLIQGYYVSRPKPIMLYEVSDSVCRDIQTLNIYSTTSVIRPYHPAEGEEVDLGVILADGYNSLFIENEVTTLCGRSDIKFDMVIMIKSNAKVRINFENVKFKTEKDSPIVAIGDGSEVSLWFYGDNELDGRGIYVPRTATLKMYGEGNVNIIANNEDCYGIGVNRDNSHGMIVLATKGTVNITANGDTAVGIGGGKNEASQPIQLLGGEVNVSVSGGSCIGIGAADGNAIVDFSNVVVKMTMSSPDNVAVGSFNGNTDIELKNFTLDTDQNGISVVGVGSVESGSGKLILTNGIMNSKIKGRTVNYIGTREGNLSCHLKKNFITFYCESGSVSGIGDMYGEGDVILEQNHLDFDMRTGEGLAYGSKTGTVKCIDPDDDIRINP